MRHEAQPPQDAAGVLRPGGGPARPGRIGSRLVTLLVVGVWTVVAGCAGVPEIVLQESLVAEPPPTPPGDPLARYLSLAPPDDDAPARGLAALDRALVLLGDGDGPGAAAEFEQVRADLPTLEDWIPLWMADAKALAGDTGGVRASLDLLDPRTRIRERWGWAPLARAHAAAGDPARGSALAAAGARDGEPVLAALAWLLAGELAVEAGDSAGARVAFLEVLTADPASLEAVRAAGRLADFPGVTPDERYQVGRVYFAHGNWRRAREGLEARLARLDPESAEAVELRIDVGVALHREGRHREAERTLLPLTGDPGVHPEGAARALLTVGLARAAAGRRAEGKAALESVAERFPSTSAAGEALLALADLEEEAGREGAALSYYRRALDLGAAGARADAAPLRVAVRAYFEGRASHAAEIFDEHAAAHEGPVAQQAAYWAGLAHRRSGDEDAARERFLKVFEADPLSYYGVQAADQLSENMLPAGLPPGPTGAGASPDELRNAVLRLAVHRRVPTAGSFAFELARLRAHFGARDGGVYDLAEALVEGGLPLQGIVLAREILRVEAGWNVRLLRLVYPLPHRDLIVSEARRNRLDPFLVAGLIRQESMFDTAIVSRAGAVGLMQVMPATAGGLARELGLSGFRPSHLARPDVNVRLGTRYLAVMLRRFDGRSADALVAYNAGPTRIRRWRDLPEYRDPDVFVERIPFRETRNYVKVVHQNARIYAALYGCGDFQPCLPGAEDERWAGGGEGDGDAAVAR